MRDCFVRELFKYASNNPRVMLITGDLGFGVLTQFAKELPAQFLNAGVAEQNMTGVATGLALEGRIVFTYSIANFPTLRCLEQIRNDVLYHGANVNVVAVGGGFSYGSLGMSHHATEDVAIMRSLPSLRVFAPCDETETAGLVKQMVEDPAPSYIRLDKSKVAQDVCQKFINGKFRQMRHGSDVAMVAYGGIVDEALDAAVILEVLGISCAVYSAHTLKPFDSMFMVELAKRYGTVATIEEHVAAGGLGSLAAEAFLDVGVIPKRFAKICLPDSFCSIVGSQEYLRGRHSLDAESIAKRLFKLIESNV